MFSTDEQNITAQAQTEIAIKASPTSGTRGPLKSVAAGPAGAAKPSIAVDEVLDLFWVLQEQSDG